MLLLAGSLLLISASGPVLTEHDKAYYTDPKLAAFVRPGLVIKVTSAEIAADGTIRARVKLTDPRGLPLDREGAETPGAVSVSLIAAYIPKGQSQYVAYTTRAQTSPITKVTAVQAGTDSGGAWARVAEGEYQYTFGTKAPAGFDRTVTHAIGAYGSRNLSEFELGTQYDDDVYNFVPNGARVTVVRDIIRTATCNKCHDQMAFHGGSRRTIELCNLCHQPQTTDPDTGNTVDMPVMIHKIHMGSGLPSVRAGGKYQIIGRNQTVADYSKIAFPADARNCGACHEAGPAQAGNVYFKPNRAACGACHDDIDWYSGANHVDLPQFTDNMCSTCHVIRGELEFDASIQGAHTIPRFSTSLPGIRFEILEVADGVAGKRPTVVFNIKDRAGNPIRPSQMSRLNLILAGPNRDYTTYVSEAALLADGPPGGPYYWTFQAAIPADAKGSYTIEIEGRREFTLLQGTLKQVAARDTGPNKVFYFSVDGSKLEPRRTVVATAKCNACHSALAFHGDNRNAVEACVICHNPTRAAGPGASLPIDFRTMIHRIHTGKELQIPYAFSATVNFNEVGYPGDRRNCQACHVNDSEQLPLKDGLLPVNDPSLKLNPVPPATAACLGCHTSQSAVQHAAANISRLGESCAVCHGRNYEFSVNRVHAR